MKKLFTIYAIALFAVFSCTVPEEQIPEEIINPEEVEAPVELQSILPDEMTISSDGAPSTKAGAIDAYDDQLLSGALGEDYTESLKNKVFWDNGDRIDFFGYSYIGGPFCNMVYETNCYGDIQSRVSNVTIRRITEEGSVITAPLSIPDQGDVRSEACIAIYPAGIVYNGESGLNGAWDPEGCTLKLNLPNHYDLDPESRAADNFNDVRGMKLQAPMLGFYFMNGGTNFYHLGGILKVNFSGIARGVKYFKVTTPGKKINGEFVISVSADENNRPYIALVDTETKSEQTIKFEYPDGEWANAINFNHDLYIPLPVGTYDEISVDVYDASHVILGHWETSNFTITRGKLKFISSYAVEDIIKVIEDVTDTNISVSQSGDRAGKGVAVDFDAINNSSKDYTLYYDGAGKNPKNVYVTGGSSTHVGIISGDLGNSTVDFIGGTFEGSALTTAANTLNIRKGATVKNITINGGNARVFGEYKNIVVAAGAHGDNVSTPVTVTINPSATAIEGSTPTVTLNAPSNVVIAKPEVSGKANITEVKVVVASTADASAITVGENIVADIKVAANTSVSVETEVADNPNIDADGAITIDQDTQGDITSVWDGKSKSPLTETEGIYYIYTAAQLAQFAADVNAGTTYSGKTVKLMCNIDLNNQAWTPIGLGGNSAADDLGSETGCFLGTFDGNHKTISNLKVTHNNDDRSFAGLFGTITVTKEKTVTIKDVTVSGVDVNSEHMAAGILARYDGVSASAQLVIDGCSVVGTPSKNTITSTPFTNSQNKKESGNQAAGIVGCAFGTGGYTIQNCSVSGVTIQGTRDLGAIAGAFLPSGSSTFANNSASNCTITQVYPNDLESGKDMTTVHELVGRTPANWEVPASNTATNVTIILQEGTVVARIGNTNYTSLAAAFAAANDAGNVTITLLCDYDFEANEPGYGWTTAYLAEGETATRDNMLVISGNNITFELSGHTISNLFNNTFKVSGTNVTFQNGEMRVGQLYYSNAAGTNIYTSDNDKTCSYIMLVAGATNFVVNNLTTYGGINVCEGSTATINDLSFSGTKFYAVCSQENSTVTLNGGTFTKAVTGATGNLFWIEAGSTMNITGGTFIKGNAAFRNGNVNPVITGGTFDFDPTNFGVAAGYESYQDGNVWKIREVQGVAQIGNDTYATLDAAVSAAEDGATIKVIKAGDYTIPAIEKNLTFDAKVDGVVVNHNSNATAIATIASDKKATFKNITFNLGNSYYHGFGTSNNRTSGELEMDGCHIEGSLSLYGVSTLKNCTFTATNGNAGSYNIWAVLKNATFTNCTFTNTNRAVNVYDFKHTTNPKNVSFSGCTFTATGNEKKKAAINIHHNPDANKGFDAAIYNVSITNCTAAGSNWATSVAETGEDVDKTVCNSGLWMISDIVNWNAEIHVTVDGTPVQIINQGSGGGQGAEGNPFLED